MSPSSNRSIMVAGGAGEIGEGIVRAYLDRGATVFVPSRNWEMLDTLVDELRDVNGTFVPIHDRTDTFEGALAIKDKILDRTDHIDVVVASLGGVELGERLVDTRLVEWENVLRDNLTSHFITAKIFFPLVEESGGHYVMINFSGGEQPLWNAGPVSIASAAQFMMKDVLCEEARNRETAVTSVVVRTPVSTRAREKQDEGWLSCEQVGRYVAWTTEEGKDLVAGRTIPLDKETYDALAM